MRGRQEPQASMLAFVDVETRIPLDHPLRTIKYVADEALADLSPLFDAMYAEIGRPSIPPERLLKASLLISLYSVRSEYAFCEELDYHLLFRWFLGMDMVEPSFDSSTFSKNRERLLQHQVAREFFDAVVRRAAERNLLSDEHFTVDGTLIEAAASVKSFRPKEQPPSNEPPTILAIRPSTSAVSGARIRRTRARLIPRRAWPGKAKAKKPVWRTQVTR